MDNSEKKLEKIYSRNRIHLPKLQSLAKEKHCNSNLIHNDKRRKIIKIIMVLTITFLVADAIMNMIEPIIDAQCINMAKSIATKISNEQATIVMSNYQYGDLMEITKDEDGNIKMIHADMLKINKIISDIPVKIQEELNHTENSCFYIKLGTFTGNKLLAGRGPDIEIKMSTIGNIETDLKSEFKEAGINQTLHRLYLEVRCNVIILTPFDSIEQQIVNQVLLAEGVIVGDIPSTYYDLQNLNQDNLIDIVE